jgi:hypothetical protein
VPGPVRLARFPFPTASRPSRFVSRAVYGVSTSYVSQSFCLHKTEHTVLNTHNRSGALTCTLHMY